MDWLRQNWPLEQWQKHLDVVYGRVNSERSICSIYGRLIEMMAGLCRGVRDNSEQTKRDFSPRVLAWLLALSSKLEVDLQEALFKWYPGVCPHCRAAIDCKCILGPRESERLPEGDEAAELRQAFDPPETLQDLLGMFARIYGMANQEVGVGKIFMHILEEFGENHEIIRHGLTSHPVFPPEEIRRRTEQELADLFAWYAAVVNLEYPEVDANMKDVYAAFCPDCGTKPCKCPPDFVHREIRLTGRSR